MLKALFLWAVFVYGVTAADLPGIYVGTMETNGIQIPISVRVDGLLLSCAGAICEQSISGTAAIGEASKLASIETGSFDEENITFKIRDVARGLVNFRLKLNHGNLDGEAEAEGTISKVALVSATKAQAVPHHVDQVLLPTTNSSAPDQEVFKIGDGVSAPILLFRVPPDYSEVARAANRQGTVLLAVEIASNGYTRNIRVLRSLGLGLDEKAVEAVKRWRFKPGLKEGKPVTVASTIEVGFSL